MEITQGDCYKVKISLKDDSGEPITDDLVSAVEVMLGGLKKTYPTDVTFEDGNFVFPLSDEESRQMHGIIPFKIRTTFLNGDAVCVNLGAVEVNVYDGTGD